MVPELIPEIYSKDAMEIYSFKERFSQITSALKRFFSHLQEKEPSVYEQYRLALEKRLVPLISPQQVDVRAINTRGFQEELAKNDELEKLYFIYSYQLLEIPEGYSSDTIELPSANVIKHVCFPFYHRVDVLCEIIRRDKAIDFIKKYIDETCFKVIQPNMELEDLDHIWNSDPNSEGSVQPAAGVSIRINRGKIARRVDHCLWYELMKPFNDPELSHLICCYGDKSAFEARNPNFVFTRTTTLIEGGPYCDNCSHDRRHLLNIEHPEQEFYQNLGAELQ